MQNEFEEAVKLLNACIGSVSCGVTLSPAEDLFADSLYYRCREYMKVYWEQKFGLPK